MLPRPGVSPGIAPVNWTAIACWTALIAGCANSPLRDERSAPGAGQPAVDERREARALEQAEADCAKQGKHAEAARVEGETAYACVAR
jgi:hypothetical protein